MTLRGLAMRLCEVREGLSGIVRSLDVRLLAVADAKVALADVTAIKNTAALLEARLGRRVTDASEWERAGFPSAEAWLAHQTGTSPSKAKEALDTAERLEQLPAVTDAAEQGQLSVEQTAMIADAATADPASEERLLDAAKVRPLGQLRDECAKTKRAADPDAEETYQRLRAQRHLRFGRALDGAARMFGASTPDQIAVIKTAVEHLANELFHRARLEGRYEPRDAYLIDALEQICHDWMHGRSALDTDDSETGAGTTGTTGTAQSATGSQASGASTPDAGDAAETSDAAPPATGRTTDDSSTDTAGRVGAEAADDEAPNAAHPDRTEHDLDARRAHRDEGGDMPEPTGPVQAAPHGRKSTPPAWLGMIRVDLDALQRGQVEGDELCEIPGVGPISVETARRLLGDAAVKLVITRGVDVLNVTHLGRGPTVAQKIALLWQSPGCAITSCARIAGIEHDHKADWADTHRTVLCDLRRYCDHHHDLKTYKNWAEIELPDGTIDIVPPDDPRHPRHARAGPAPPSADESGATRLFDADDAA